MNTLILKSIAGTTTAILLLLAAFFGWAEFQKSEIDATLERQKIERDTRHRASMNELRAMLPPQKSEQERAAERERLRKLLLEEPK